MCKLYHMTVYIFCIRLSVIAHYLHCDFAVMLPTKVNLQMLIAFICLHKNCHSVMFDVLNL